MNTQKNIGIDLFSGAGGLSLGAMAVGIKIPIAIEHDVYAAKTYKRNHPESEVIVENIRNIDLNSVEVENPFIVFGGPPCQGFSTSNTKTRTMDNKENSLFKEFVRFVERLAPKWFLFENVEGIVSFNNGEIIDNIKKCFENIGYSTVSEVLNASDYGVPQNRNRFFMVGNNQGIHFTFPIPNKNKVTVKDAIGDLPFLENGQKDERLPYRSRPSLYAKLLRKESPYAYQCYVSRNKDYVIERYKHIKAGQNWEAIPKHLMKNYKNTKNCHSGIYRRLDPSKTSIVISNYRKNMLIHPFQDRGLSVREAARIQSFPDNYIFEGSLMQIQQQIGNAVPPIMAEKIFQQIMRFECQIK